MQVFFVLIATFLVFRLLVTITNVIFNPKLPIVDTTYSDSISILIPARNESGTIAETIQHILKQDYQAYEILVLNDQSTDNTAQLVQSFSSVHENISLIEGEELPDGWLGKNWACHQLAQAAKGDYLLFIDADVTIHNQLINSALSAFEKHQLNLLSIFPDQELHTWGERVVVPIMHYLLLTMLPLNFIRWLAPASLAAANGQFMFFSRQTYLKYCFHQQVRTAVTEDIEIVKYIKKNGMRASTYLGNHLVRCRMYTGWQDATDGFSKNLLAGFGHVVGLLVFITFVAIGYLPLLWTKPMLTLYLLPIILITNALVAWLSNQPIGQTIVLHPFKIISLCLIACLSIYRNLTKTNQWKGRNISIK